MTGHVIQDFILAYWVTDKWEEVTDSEYYRAFAIACALTLLTIVVRSLCVAAGALIAARRSHDQVVAGLLGAKMAFYDETPASVIMTRMGRDQQLIDQTLAAEFSDLFTFVSLTIATLVVITTITPFFIISMLPIAILFHFVSRYYVSTARQLKVFYFWAVFWLIPRVSIVLASRW